MRGAERTRFIRSRTPAWADRGAMSCIYRVSKSMGLGWHVDHIVPLVSYTVCGLHCEFNLRVVPRQYNLSKSNCHWPDMWADHKELSLNHEAYQCELPLQM